MKRRTFLKAAGGAGALAATARSGSALAANPEQGAIDQSTARATGSTTARALADRFAENRNVKDFGAKGDGVADDRAAIQAAIDAAGGGATIFFPPGTYRLASFHPSSIAGNILQMSKSDLTFRGCGGASVIQLGRGTFTGRAFNVFSNYDSPSAAKFGTYRNITFRSLFFDLSGAENPFPTIPAGPRVAVQFGDTNNATVEDCTFDNMNVSNTIAVGRPGRSNWGFRVSGCRFIDPSDGDTRNVDHSTIYANAEGSIIAGNQFANSTARGRVISTSCELHDSNSSYTGNTVSGYRQAVYIASEDSEHESPRSNFVVSNNVAQDLNAHFVVLWTGPKFGMSDVLVSGNVASIQLKLTDLDAGSAFVSTTRMGTFSRVRITDNNCAWLSGKANPSRGVVTFSSLSDFVVARNTFSGAKYALSLITANAADQVILRRVSILDNHFVECGDGDIGMNCESAAKGSVIDGLVVQGNKFFSTKPLARPMYFAAPAQRNYVMGRNETVDFSPAARLVTFGGTPPSNFVNEITRKISDDRGDANVTLAVGVDSEVQRFATPLTANRSVTLSDTSAANGSTFRIVRTGLGPFSLEVGRLKAIGPGSAGWVEATFDGTAWRLTGSGAL